MEDTIPAAVEDGGGGGNLGLNPPGGNGGGPGQHGGPDALPLPVIFLVWIFFLNRPMYLTA